MTQEDIEVTELDIIYEAHDRLDALLELLVEKGVISEEEYENKLEEVIQRNEDLDDEE